MLGSALSPARVVGRRRRRIAGTLLGAAALTLGSAGAAQAALSVNDIASGATATGLANSLAGSGVTVSNVTYTGSDRAGGTFSGGTGIIGFGSGVVLDSGKAATAPGDLACEKGVEGPNTCNEAGGGDNSSAFGTAGDADLNTLSGVTTNDASVLEFDFVPQQATVQFKYVFSSDEYSNYSNTQYNDAFGFYVNGTNCALVPGTSEPVSINTINNGNDAGLGDVTPHNPSLFIDNVHPAPSLDTEMDGLTVVLTCSATVNPGVTNHMKLAIADGSDANLDSAVFLQAQSLVSSSITLTPQTATNPVGTSHTVTATVASQGTAVPGKTVSFAVISGPNTGQSGSAVTDTSGQATFTYLGAGGPGTDTIRASFVDDSNTTQSTTATKIWTGPASGPLYLDLFNATNSQHQATVFGTDPLTPGAGYTITVRGTGSLFAPKWSKGSSSSKLCGTPEPAPIFDSTHTSKTGEVGVDPEFAFAKPVAKAAACGTVPQPRGEFQLSTDGGGHWFNPTPTGGAPGAPTGNHSYTYGVIGTGGVIAARYLDPTTSDNYGMFQITTAPVSAVKTGKPLAAKKTKAGARARKVARVHRKATLRRNRARRALN